MQIGFIGLGKLGLPCAEAMATHYSVTGYDIYDRSSDTIKISPSLEGAVKGKDIVFVAVQTPHDPVYDGSWSRNIGGIDQHSVARHYQDTVT